MSSAARSLRAGQVAHADAASVLGVLVAALLFIPSRYALTQIAGFVTPAFMVGLFAALWWGWGRILPSLGAAQGRQPVRMAVYFLLWAAVASCCGLLVRDHTDTETRALLTGLFVLLSAAGVALLAADGLRSKARLDWLLRLAVIGTALVGVIVVLQFFLDVDIAVWLRPPGFSIIPGGLDFIQQRSGTSIARVAGTAAHPIEMGVVLAMMLPPAIHYSRFPGRHGPLPYQAATVLITFASFLTVSRTTIVAIVVEALILLPTWHQGLRRRALVAAAAVVGAVLVAAPGVVGTLVGLFTNASTDNSFLHRVNDYGAAVHFIAGSPFIGRGIGTWIPTNGYGSLAQPNFFIDNSYLLTFLEMGAVGVLSLVLLFAVGIGVARGARRRSADPATRDLGQSLAASIAVAMVTTFTYDSLSFPMATGITFLLMGCAGALWRMEGGAAARQPAAAALPAPG
jgi:polysaccharide biosynthesis protein PslJ